MTATTERPIEEREWLPREQWPSCDGFNRVPPTQLDQVVPNRGGDDVWYSLKKVKQDGVTILTVGRVMNHRYADSYCACRYRDAKGKHIITATVVL